MVLKKKFPIRILAIAGALLVLFSCVPVLPANAAADNVSDTSWYFDSLLTLPLWSGSLASYIQDEVSFSVEFNSVIMDCTDIIYDRSTGQLLFDVGYGTIFAYDFYTSTWQRDSLRTIWFTSAMGSSVSFVSWLTSNATQLSGTPVPTPSPTDPPSGNTFETIIVLGGNVYTFTSESSYPFVTCVITPDFTVLTDGTTFYEWYPIASLKFLGFSLSADDWDDPHYRVEDEEFYFQGSDTKDILQLYPCYAVGSDGTDSPSDSDSDLGDLTSLFGPIFHSVSAFFSLEFIPGFSFGRIFVIALVVGLLFFFLKFAK